MQNNNQAPESYIRLRDIIGDKSRGIPAIVSVSKSTLWQWVRDNKFPQPLRGCGSRITLWKLSEVLDFLERTAQGGEK
jgi:prophage regulatory protein